MYIITIAYIICLYKIYMFNATSYKHVMRKEIVQFIDRCLFNLPISPHLSKQWSILKRQVFHITKKNQPTQYLKSFCPVFFLVYEVYHIGPNQTLHTNVGSNGLDEIFELILNLWMMIIVRNRYGKICQAFDFIAPSDKLKKKYKIWRGFLTYLTKYKSIKFTMGLSIM